MAAVHAVLDASPISHVATVRCGRPVVLPMAHGRIGDMLYLHGSAAAGLFRDTAAGSPVCVTATLLDGLRAIVDHIIAGRWDQIRKPTSAELRETGLWRVPVAEASVKARTGSTLDPDSDRAIPVWAGVIPAQITFGPPVPAEGVPPGIEFSGLTNPSL